MTHLESLCYYQEYRKRIIGFVAHSISVYLLHNEKELKVTLQGEIVKARSRYLLPSGDHFDMLRIEFHELLESAFKRPYTYFYRNISRHVYGLKSEPNL